MRKLLFVFGTRPEAIKMAPVIREAKARAERFETLVCVTAQHREMLDQVLSLFGTVPDYDLDIMRPNQDLYDITAKALTGMRTVLASAGPDIVLVHGDTSTAFAAALAAFYRHVPVAHVEAGLRTGDLSAPWPEEANRLLVDRLSTWLFAPTEAARQNLARENHPAEHIFVTGNTVIDALLSVWADVTREGPTRTAVLERLRRTFAGTTFDFERQDDARPLMLITGHRRENFGRGFAEICEALREIAAARPNARLVYPVHLNPNVTGPVRKILGDIANVYLVPPVDYACFVYLMGISRLILTDSGGVQEEAPSLGVPVLVTRDVTERPEAVAAGTAVLIGPHKDAVLRETFRLLDAPAKRGRANGATNPYGDGLAARRILDALER